MAASGGLYRNCLLGDIRMTRLNYLITDEQFIIMTSQPPNPTPIHRILHIDNLAILLDNNVLHAPNHFPPGNQNYKPIHRVDIQTARASVQVPCGPGGTIPDYIPFYFGYRSPMLFQLHTDKVEGYNGGQNPIIYLVSDCQSIERNRNDFVFTDGQALVQYSAWYYDLADLDKVSWDIVYEKFWFDNENHMDRQRRKMAEFLIHKTCGWELITEISVISAAMKQQVEQILLSHPNLHHPPVTIQRQWYY